MKHATVPTLLLTAMLTCLGTTALAQDRDGRHDPRARGPERAHAPPGWHLDQRYHHDHYYPPHGYGVSVLPAGSISIGFGGGNWFFHAGVWFRPLGGRFIVSAPPIGIFVPLLPPAYATLWIGGAPFYYANGVYYAPAPGQGYAVVNPPIGAATALPLPVAPATVAAPGVPAPLIIYPRNNQSAAQTETDRQECNVWAGTQANATTDATVFNRAIAACLDGRGYTVR